MKEKSTSPVQLLFMALFAFCAIYAVVDQISEIGKNRKVVVERVHYEPMQYENVDSPECQGEKEFIIRQINRLERAISNLEENYKNLSEQEFEKYLTQWNRDIESNRNEIDNYNYSCFKSIGIKGLGTLAVQLGTGYVSVVMYNDDSDVLLFKSRIEETIADIMASLN
jgi:hypothetical protein